MLMMMATLLKNMTRSLDQSLRVSSYDDDDDENDDDADDDDDDDDDEDDDDDKDDKVSLPVFACQLIASREVVYSLVTLC